MELPPHPAAARVKDDHILLNLSYHDRNIGRALGATWDKGIKMWRLPASPGTAAAARNALRAANLYDPSYADDAFRKLADEAVKQDRVAQSAITAPISELEKPLTKYEPWEHQLRAYNFVKPLDGALLHLEMGCLAADTPIITSRGGFRKTETYTIAELHEKLEAARPGGGRVFDPETGRIAGNVWDSEFPCHVRGLIAEHDAVKTVAVAASVKRSGLRPVMKITLSDNRTLRCTPDHEIYTPMGKMPAIDLYPGAGVYVDDTTGVDWSHYRIERVKTVEYDGEDVVYDLEVNDSAHIYNANGFLVGNTGKTKVAVDVTVNRQHRKILVVCPLSAAHDVWGEQVPQHDGSGQLEPLVLDSGSVKSKTEEAKAAFKKAEVLDKPAMLVINYESYWREPFASWSLNAGIDMLILDESHRVKSPKGKAAKHAAALGDVVKHKLLLTGTPLPHSPLDAWSQYRVIDPGVFGTSFYHFKMRYAVLGGYANKAVVNFKNTDEFKKKFGKRVFRVDGSVLDLPEAMDQRRTFDLEPEVARVYRNLEKDFYAAVGTGEVTVNNALTKLLRLQQLTGGWVMLDEEEEVKRISTAKADLLQDLLSDMGDSEPVVIFCRFRGDLQAVHEVAEKLGRGSLELSGSRRELQDWKSGPSAPPILAVQIQSGGTGIDLTRSRYAVYYSVGFSLGDYLQSRKRLHRPGQDRKVVYYHLVGRNTIDERVYRALEKRQDLVESVVSEPVEIGG